MIDTILIGVVIVGIILVGLYIMGRLILLIPMGEDAPDRIEERLFKCKQTVINLDTGVTREIDSPQEVDTPHGCENKDCKDKE